MTNFTTTVWHGFVVPLYCITDVLRNYFDPANLGKIGDECIGHPNHDVRRFQITVYDTWLMSRRRRIA